MKNKDEEQVMSKSEKDQIPAAYFAPTTTRSFHQRPGPLKLKWLETYLRNNLSYKTLKKGGFDVTREQRVHIPRDWPIALLSQLVRSCNTTHSRE